MTEQELQEKRRHKWRLDGRAVRTLEEAREWVESVGFALLYPVRPPVLAPTFVGAWVGADDRLPTWQHAFEDERARQATELMVRLLRERAAFEASLAGENSLLVAASIFPYFFALAGERNLRPDGGAPERADKFSPLARDAFAAIQRAGPLSKPRMKELLGGEPSTAALDRALSELWSKLRITRVDYNPRDGASWDVLARWAPEAVKEAVQLSLGEALSALVSKYLDCVVAAEAQEVEAFFSPIVPRSKVKESMNALLATRELSFVHVGHRTLVEVTPARVEDARRGPPLPRRKKASPA
ncbi:MAG TPA: hypothetical protein VEG08_14485 [Terriglobales bacterium]|nr:hypothetical protein [Terriglobales bacterium]